MLRHPFDFEVGDLIRWDHPAVRGRRVYCITKRGRKRAYGRLVGDKLGEEVPLSNYPFWTLDDDFETFVREVRSSYGAG